ncbi:hypothetical protein AO896_29985 [Pseudomonas aeruginosa]|nr:MULTISPECIES: phage tail assembly chaperone [Pseudomonas aeruginosa group]MBH8716147.1 phage tail protein [Pseudomonas aeruginosa]MBH9342050.1 phage tail protein [Pseudomonas aeruginosa]MBH9397030.1 phage tail protein [Pseudomonas aeruginosa]MBI8112758.1 phage tail protein [Pseudomonas aeruginosa]MCW8358442.1 phage tail assembly chaperone [Pseudomonas aeruginosa]
MPIYYSDSLSGFIDSDLQSVPVDAVPVDQETHKALLCGQSGANEISMSAGGVLSLKERSRSPLDLAAGERAWRDGELLKTDCFTIRHREELELGVKTTLTSVEFHELLSYRQRLREWPETEDFPMGSERPQTPSCISSAFEETV